MYRYFQNGDVTKFSEVVTKQNTIQRIPTMFAQSFKALKSEIQTNDFSNSEVDVSPLDLYFYFNRLYKMARDTRPVLRNTKLS